MSQKARPTLIGAFVVGAVALVVVGLLLFGSGRFFTDRTRWVAYFDESVAGLTVGSPVTFRGVRVGQVVKILAQVDSEDLKVRIPVILDIQRSRFERIGTVERDVGVLLVQRGLRAQLTMISIVTGQLGIQLDFHPDEPVQPVKSTVGYPQMPTIPSQFAQIARSIERLSLEQLVTNVQVAVEAFTALITSGEVEETIAEANATMKQTRLLASNLNQRVDPIADSLEEALALASESSPLRFELLQALREMTAAARSVRVLAEQLERQPDALLRGKRAAGGY